MRDRLLLLLYVLQDVAERLQQLDLHLEDLFPVLRAGDGHVRQKRVEDERKVLRVRHFWPNTEVDVMWQLCR